MRGVPFLLAMALWTGPSRLAGAIRDGRLQHSSRWGLFQDATSTSQPEDIYPSQEEVCCVCQGGLREFSSPKSRGCPSTCGQRDQPFGCAVSAYGRVIYKTTQTTPTMTTTWTPTWMCCVCQVGFGYEERTLPAGSTCPPPCKKKKGNAGDFHCFA